MNISYEELGDRVQAYYILSSELIKDSLLVEFCRLYEASQHLNI